MKDLLIDLDNTIYSESSRIFDQIDLKMKNFISSELKVNKKEAYAIQKKYFLENGTTLRGLMLYHDIKPDKFLKYVHDINLDSIKKNSSLEKELVRFKGRKIIFTNGTRDHAERVLRKVGVFDKFNDIFDIKDASYIPKPETITYEKVVNKYKLIPHNTVMIDDIVANLITAKKIGMSTVLVGNIDSEKNKDFIDHAFKNLALIIKKINDKDIFDEY